MSEREMRQVLAALRADLDRRARQLGRGVKKAIIPAAIGAGLALGAGGCSDDSGTRTDAKVQTEAGVDARVDIGPLPPYGSPDRGALPPYSAPDVGVDGSVDGSIDGGAGPLYMGPPADGGPMPPYMAPDSSK